MDLDPDYLQRQMRALVAPDSGGDTARYALRPPTRLRSRRALGGLVALPQYRATVRVAPEIVRAIRGGGRFARIEEEASPDATSWITLRICFDGERMAREFALGFGTQLVVEEPRALREYVVREAAGIAPDDEKTDKKEPPDCRQQSGGNEEGGWRVSRHE